MRGCLHLLFSLATSHGYSSGDVLLVSFASDADPSVSHKWKALNDPVMGGQSVSRVQDENNVLNFTGTCAIVPSLKAPGFITAVTGNGFLAHETFVDVSTCHGLKVVAKDFTNGYKGYRISFGTAKPPGGKFFAQGFKANLRPTVGSFGAVSIPFSSAPLGPEPWGCAGCAPSFALPLDAQILRTFGTTRRAIPSTAARRTWSTARTSRRSRT